MYDNVVLAIDKLKEFFSESQATQLEKIEDRLKGIEKQILINRMGHEEFDWDNKIEERIDPDDVEEALASS